MALGILFLLLLLVFLREDFVGLRPHIPVFLERLDQSRILLVAELEAGRFLHLAQLFPLQQEFHCGRESNIQFSYYFI